MNNGKDNQRHDVKIDLPVDDNLMELVDELTENDDDVIDLVEELDPHAKNDDEIIDLIEEVEDDVFDLENGDVIDLVDEVDDNVINLEEEVNVKEDEERANDLADDTDESEDSDYIDLELESIDIKETEVEENGDGIIDLADAFEEANSVAERADVIDDKIKGADSYLSDVADAEDDEKYELSDVEVTEKQIDAALERVIRKMFAERIDGILTTLIDRTIIRELKKLQDKLMNS
ncbi:MAG: hypothetical protein KJ737_07100 [Proteobacteria bacterium]|nr:hypothetical protein [Pseudomonadota bacterium]